MEANAFATSSSTLILNGHTFNDFQLGDFIELNPVNPRTSQIRGVNSVNIAKRADAGVRELIIRVMRYGDDDIFLSSQENADIPVIFNGSLVTNYQNSRGVASVETWDLEAGSFTEQPPVKYNNQDGDAMQEYMILINEATRTI